MREEHYTMVHQLAPTFDEWDRTRRLAAAESRTAFIG